MKVAGIDKTIARMTNSRCFIDYIVTSNFKSIDDLTNFEDNCKLLEEKIDILTMADAIIYIENEKENDKITNDIIANTSVAFTLAVNSSLDEVEKIRILKNKLFIPIIIPIIGSDPFTSAPVIKKLIEEPGKHIHLSSKLKELNI